MKPVVVFLHGRGLGPDSVSEVLPAFPGARVLAPQGGVTLKRGHTWFLNERIGVARPESVADAIGRFMPWFDAEVIGPAYLAGPSGADATIRTYDIGHAIAEQEVSDLSAWFEVL